jgi:hypothetical protein
MDTARSATKHQTSGPGYFLSLFVLRPQGMLKVNSIFTALTYLGMNKVLYNPTLLVWI